MFQRWYTHSSDIPETKLFWTSTWFQYKDIGFREPYMNQSSPSLFHTGSVAEFHKYPWSLLLHKYVKALDTPSTVVESMHILTSDADFVKALQSYQHVVSHYLSSKMEIWIGLCMHPIHGVKVYLPMNLHKGGEQHIFNPLYMFLGIISMI